jgi:TRAP-type C4-dicarboxylate transport system permease small subunit
MSSTSTPSGAAGPSQREPLIERITGNVAMLGGLIALGVAVLVVCSVLGRWLFGTPIEGDFEFVKMATAMAIFAYLPYTQARRGNIIVDTFTGWLPKRAVVLIDAFWDLCYLIFMMFCATGLVVGTAEAFKSRETTMQLQLLVWPVIAVCAALCILLAITSLVTAMRLIGSRT